MAAVTFLGTGPGDVVAGRFQASILLECSGQDVLLDAGEPCSGRLLELGFSLNDLDAVWLTHAHTDHVGGLPLLLQACRLHGRDRALPVGMPGRLVEPLEKWLEAVYLPKEGLGFALEAFAWQDGVPVVLGDLSVVPRHTTHLAAEDGREAFLFDISDADRRVVYSGDLGSVDDLDGVLDRPMDLLVCELSHFSPADLAAKLQKAKIGVLCLTHVAAALELRREEIKRQFEAAIGGVDAVYLPEDGERIEF